MRKNIFNQIAETSDFLYFKPLLNKSAVNFIFLYNLTINFENEPNENI